MIDNISSLPLLPLDTASRLKDSPQKIKDAACQFEALMIGQLLKTAREAGSSGWLGTGDDQAGQTGMDIAEQELARSMASSGGIGLAKIISASLERAAK